GAPAPGAARRLARGLVVAGGIEAVPRDVGLRIPVQALALAVELAERRHFRGELKWKAPLDELLLLRLIGAEQPRRVFRHLAHRGTLIAGVSLRGRQPRGKMVDRAHRPSSARARPPRSASWRPRSRAPPTGGPDRLERRPDPPGARRPRRRSTSRRRRWSRPALCRRPRGRARRSAGRASRYRRRSSR